MAVRRIFELPAATSVSPGDVVLMSQGSVTKQVDVTLLTGVGGAASWVSITGKPTTLSGYGITDTLVTSVAGRAGAVALVKADVGLGSVDNTADTAKPVSTAQQTALNLKANLASPAFTGTVTGITAAMVGAQPAGTYATGGGTATGTNTGDQVIPTTLPASDVSAWAKAPTKPAYTAAEVGLGSVNNTADAAKSVGYAATAGSASNHYGTAGNYIASSTSGTSYGSCIQVREAGLGGVQGGTMAFAPRLGFHWSGNVASSIAMESSGRMAICNNPGTGYEDLVAKVITATSFVGSAASLTGLTSGQITTALGYTPGNPGGLTVAVVSTSTTAVSGTTYVLTASLTLTLPATPAVGAQVSISNRSGVATCVVARNGQNIMGLAEDMTLNVSASLSLVFADATRGWVLL